MKSKKEQNIVLLGIILFIITASAGVLLGCVHQLTLKPIEVQENKANNMAMAQVLSTADEFILIKDIKLDGYSNIAEVYETKNKSGYVFKVRPNGYGGKIDLVVGIDSNSKVSGIEVIKHSETPGLGAKAKDDAFKSQFVDKNAEEEIGVTKSEAKDNEITAISGATITSRAIVNGVNEAIKCYNEQIKGKEA